MAAEKKCNEFVPYSPDEVFGAGILVETLPTHPGFFLETDGPRFEPGLAVNIGLIVAHHSWEVEAIVKEFEPAKRVLIEGKANIGTARVWLDLRPAEEESGTIIAYGVRIGPALRMKTFEPLIQRHLSSKLPDYAAEYRQNVVDVLSTSNHSSRHAKRKKAA
jgi:hypothetical protein